MSRIQAPYLTTLDMVKAAAVLLMIVDHLGMYFFTGVDAYLAGADPIGGDALWWRVAGRWSVLIWFFLIGYANSRDLTLPIWIGAGVVLATSVILGMYVFPVNALFSIILVRLVLDKVAVFAFERPQNFFITLFGCTLLSLPTYYFWEYGTLGLMMALVGYAARHRGNPALPLLTREWTQAVLFWTTLVVFAVVQEIFLMFGRLQFAVMTLGCAIVLQLLISLPKREWPILDSLVPGQARWLIQLCGRHTLEIYVLHLILFRMIAWAGDGFGFPLYGFMDWDWLADDAAKKALALRS